MPTVALFCSHHILRQCAVQILELSPDVSVFVEHVMNENIPCQEDCKIAITLFIVDVNTDKKTNQS